MTSKTQNSRWSNRWCVAGVVTLAVGCAGFIWGTVRDHNVTGATQSVIVRARSLLDATRAVEAVGGEVTAELEIIDGVAATLSGQALRTLRAEHHEVTTFPNASVDVAAKRKKGRGKGPTTNATDFPGVIEADRLHELGLTGRGVTVAVVDTGVHYVTELGWGLDGRLRIHPYSVTAPFGVTGNVSDKNGHGTHLSSIIANKTKTRKGKKFESVAPDVDLVAVQAFDGAGRGTYANVITGLQWILTNKDVHNIRVVNLSFSAPPRSHYWDDPINRAVWGSPSNRSKLRRWLPRVPARTTRGRWVSFRLGSGPMLTAWTTWSGCDGPPPASPARPAVTLGAGGWAMAGSCAPGAAVVPL